MNTPGSAPSTASDENSGESAFSADQYANAYPPDYELHYWHRARAALVLKRVLRGCPRDSVILEIGCGRGLYVKVLREAGFDVFGCDLATPPVHSEVKQFIFSGVEFSALDGDLKQRVDTILLLDVIEHIESDGAFIREITHQFPKLATVLITVPARREIWSNYDRHYGHFRRYNLRTLSTTAEASGLSIQYISYFFHALYVMAAAFAIFGIPRATSFPRPRPKWLHKLMGKLFQLEAAILPNNIPGTSLICVGKIRR